MKEFVLGGLAGIFASLTIKAAIVGDVPDTAVMGLLTGLVLVAFNRVRSHA